MIRMFLTNEFFKNLKEPKFHISLITCFFLVVASIISGFYMYETELDWYTKGNYESLKANSYSKSYVDLKQDGTKILRKPSKMSIFVGGVDNLIGKSATVSSNSQMNIRESRYSLNPILAVFGGLDMSIIAQMVFALFAILFSYNTISGEREQGTLKLLLSNSVSRSSILVGKTLGGLLSLFIIFLLPFLAGLIFLLSAGTSFTGAEWLKIGMMAFVICLYIAVFYMVGVFFSTVTKRSSVSFLFSLFFWVFSIFIMPKVAVSVAEHLYPPLSMDELEAQKASIEREHYDILQEQMRRLYSEYYDKEKDNEAEAFQKALVEGMAEVQTVKNLKLQPIMSEYERKYNKLLEQAENFSRVSPVSNLTFTLNRLTETDVRLHSRFSETLKKFRTRFLDFVEKISSENSDKRTNMVAVDNGKDGPVVKYNFQELELPGFPKFNIERETVEQTFSAILLDVFILAFYVLVLFCGSFFCFVRYDVR